MPFTEATGRRIYYRAWRTEGPRRAIVVFAHGFGEHSGVYHRFGEALRAAGIDLWAFDQIGHGLSDGERRGDVEDLDLAVATLDALAEQALATGPAVPVVVAGHSLGGATAALAAARDRTGRYAGAILSGAPIAPIPLVDRLEQGGTFDLALTDLSDDPFYLDELEHDPLALPDTSGAESFPRLLPQAWAELDRTLPEAAAPVLFVHGESDPVVPVDVARRWARILGARAAIEIVPGAHHDVLNERANARVAAAIIRFVGTAAIRTGSNVAKA